MSRPRSSSLALACLLFPGPAPSVAAGPPAPFADEVGTLALDRALDARGNLGGITVDRLGNLYVANFRDAVWRIGPDGDVHELTRAMYGASGNAVDRRGRLYQSNFLGDTISRIDRTGAVETFVDRGLEGPVGIAIGPDDTLFVCNCRGNTLSKVLADGTVEPFAASPRFACPNGITFGDDGTLYVTNFNSHDILAVDAEGAVSTYATVPGGAGNAHLAYSKGNLYVTKIIANRVVKVTPAGEIVPVAGTGKAGHDDGPGPDATLYRPNGIAVAPGGQRLYVNTMVGEYSRPEPSRIVVRTIDLVSATSVIEDALESGSLDDAVEAYRAYKADPVRGTENTSPEMIALGYRFLSEREFPKAFEMFRLNAESYPEDATAQYQLGEFYRYTGRTDEAVAQYREVLRIAPDDPRATSRLVQLGAD